MKQNVPGRQNCLVLECFVCFENFFSLGMFLECFEANPDLFV